MSLQVEKLEKNMAKLTIEVSADDLEKALQSAYNRQKSKISIPGFRKGKVPRQMVEKMYGAEIFYDDAANALLPKAYSEAYDECGLDIVSQPKIDIVQIEKGKPFIFTAEVATKPEVTLGEYKGLKVDKVSNRVTQKEIDAKLQEEAEKNARTITVEDRPVQDGDEVILDFEGFVDGKPFDGGKAEDYDLTIGSHSFIDTFEEQLIGRNIGEECEVNVTFPEEYHAPELAGKPATFKVTVKEIKVKELPALDDEFAGEVSEFETMDEYKKDIEAKILERKQKEAATENENRVVDKVAANASLEIPDKMVESQIDNMVQDTARRMQGQGLSMDMYMKYTGMTMDSMRDQMRPQALKRIQTRLVLEEVVKAENIQVPDERLDEEIAKMAAAYQMESDKLKEYMSDRDKEQMKEDLAVQEAVDFLVAEAKLV